MQSEIANALPYHSQCYFAKVTEEQIKGAVTQIRFGNRSIALQKERNLHGQADSSDPPTPLPGGQRRRGLYRCHSPFGGGVTFVWAK